MFLLHMKRERNQSQWCDHNCSRTSTHPWCWHECSEDAIIHMSLSCSMVVLLYILATLPTKITDGIPCVSSEPVCLKMDPIRMKWAQSSIKGLHLYPFTYLTLSTNELSIRSPNWLNNTSPSVAEYLDHCSVASDFSLVLLSVKHFSADLRYKSERSLQAASEETVSPAIRYLLSLIKPSGIRPYLIQRPGCTTQSTPLSDALVCYHWNQHYQIPNVLWKGGGDATFQYENTQRSLRIEEII